MLILSSSGSINLVFSYEADRRGPGSFYASRPPFLTRGPWRGGAACHIDYQTSVDSLPGERRLLGFQVLLKIPAEGIPVVVGGWISGNEAQVVEAVRKQYEVVGLTCQDEGFQ